MRRSALFVSVLATLVVGLAGCSSETPGDATPGDDTGGGNVPSFSETPTNEEPTESSEDPGSGAADLQPCELLTAEDLAALGLPNEVNDEGDVGPARKCEWQASGSHTVSVGVIDALGIDEVQSESPPEPKNVGSHDAVQYVGLGGTCGVALAVSDSSRVDVLGIAGGDMPRACEVANQAAELVEQKLP